jgi:hypothetical protein
MSSSQKYVCLLYIRVNLINYSELLQTFNKYFLKNESYDFIYLKFLIEFERNNLQVHTN